MTSRYRLSLEALADLDQIWDYIAADKPRAATEYVRTITDNS